MRHYPVGQASVPLMVVVNDDGPVSGLTINARIFRPIDGFQWDWSDNQFKLPVSVVTPNQALVESVTQPGLYLGMWNTSGIVLATEAEIVYESTSTAFFIEDDPVSLQTGLVMIVTSFIVPVLDKTQRTLTVVFALKNALVGLLPTTAATLTMKDDLGNTLLAKNTLSTTGIHRAIFPNIDVVPNRVLLFAVSYTLGLDTFATIDAIPVLGTE